MTNPLNDGCEKNGSGGRVAGGNSRVRQEPSILRLGGKDADALAALERLKNFNIINWGERLKYCNALLLAGLLWLTADLGHNNFVWAGFCVGLPLLGYFLVVKTNTPRAIPICAIMLVYWLVT